ncbi:Trm112 family protein [Nocardia flavorosea]|uniref:Trm112 family protein n=1 Tax=Nocardia flavorosea TaxID=53429 RepID=UPI0018945F3B|nr:Trm112 family protein [Nocardia flavorosea]MBF6351579.1 Trm112 family protein [Nocardia flavorosea]
MSEHTILDPTLLSLLACPQDKGQLHLVRTGDGADVLYNPRLRVAYPVDNGIPVLLADEARAVEEAEHADFARQFGE